MIGPVHEVAKMISPSASPRLSVRTKCVHTYHANSLNLYVRQVGITTNSKDLTIMRVAPILLQLDCGSFSQAPMLSKPPKIASLNCRYATCLLVEALIRRKHSHHSMQLADCRYDLAHRLAHCLSHAHDPPCPTTVTPHNGSISE